MTLLLTDRGPFRWLIWPDLEDGITALSMTGLDTNTPNDAATPGDHASISVGYPSGVTAWTSEAWGVGTFGDTTYGTGSSPTDYTASEGLNLLWEGLGDDGNTYRASAPIQSATVFANGDIFDQGDATTTYADIIEQGDATTTYSDTFEQGAAA